MKSFESFDISDFFDEIQSPVLLMDQEEIIFVNSYCKDNFQKLPDDWRSVFLSQDGQEKLNAYFQDGEKAPVKVIQTILSKKGLERSYSWDFTRLPSSYKGRFLVARGEKREVIPEKPALFLEDSASPTQEEIQYLRTILDNTHDLVAILDADGNYKFISPSVGEKLGFTVNEIIGRNYQEFMSWGVLGIIQGDVKTVMSTEEEVNIDFWIKAKSGKKIYIESFAKNLLNDPYVNGVLFSARDVTEFVEIKETLRKSEEKYRTLVEESTEIIFSLSESFVLTYISPNVAQFLGYPSKEVIGKSVFDFLNPEDFDGFAELIEKRVEFLDQNQFLEFRLRHRDGSYRIFNSNGKIVLNKADGTKSYNGIARDISKLKEAEDAMLEEKERAEQASLVKSQFLSVMSHEIRTPLNALVGIAHILMDESPREDQLENLQTLQFSADNLTGLINDILDYSKIDSGKIELEVIPFDLRNLLTRTIHSYSFQAKEKNLQLICDVANSIPKVLLGDSVRIGQIINNLLSNAIKFTEKGSIRLSVELEHISESGIHSLNFCCSDSGIGIPEDKIETIFEAFTQASSDTTRKFGGTGLGLAIVKGLVQLHDSEITVSARAEGGTKFCFTLGFALPQQSASSKNMNGNTVSKSLQEASILVAEDNMVNQVLIKKFLTKWGAGNLVFANDGQEAIDAIEKSDFDLILLDIQMPIHDGFEVSRFIRNQSNKAKSNTPILVLTAASIHEIKEEMEACGINDFVPKPYTPEVLYDKLQNQLNKGA